MQYFVCCGKVSLNFLSPMLYLLDVLAKFILVYFIVRSLLLLRSLASRYWCIENKTALLLFIKLLELVAQLVCV